MHLPRVPPPLPEYARGSPCSSGPTMIGVCQVVKAVPPLRGYAAMSRHRRLTGLAGASSGRLAKNTSRAPERPHPTLTSLDFTCHTARASTESVRAERRTWRSTGSLGRRTGAWRSDRCWLCRRSSSRSSAGCWMQWGLSLQPPEWASSTSSGKRGSKICRRLRAPAAFRAASWGSVSRSFTERA